MSANLRLSQVVADLQAQKEKARLLSPDRPRLPAWILPSVVGFLCVWALDLWWWAGLLAFCAVGAWVLYEAIEAGDSAKRGR